MLKVTGLVLILVSAAAMGFSKSRELTEELGALEQVLRMVIYLKREISYKNASLYEALTDVSVKIPGQYALFLKSTAEETGKRKGESFGKIFRRNAELYLEETGLSKEEQKKFFSLGENLGYLDLDMQIRQLELYEKEAEDSIEELREKLPGRKRAYRSLGVLLGILLAVLMC